MRTRLLRYAGALIVSLISLYSGEQRYAHAAPQDGCSLSDAKAWQVALSDPQEEATPAYRRTVTERFIDRCAERPEIEDAHRIAAMAAAWEGKPETAAAHFEAAGYTSDTEALMMHAAVRFALGEETRASALRDEAVESWIARLVRRGIASIEIEETADGKIIAVTFDRTDREMRVSHLWIAVPRGAGWPAALSITSERQLTAFHRLRAGADAPALRHVRLYRCQSRRLLARSSQPLSAADVAGAARLGLSAYLGDPDVPAPGKLEACLFDGYILPQISPALAVPTR